MTGFDFRHAAMKFALMEHVQNGLETSRNARLAHRETLRQELVEVLKKLEPMHEQAAASLHDGANFILEAFERSEHLDEPLSRNAGFAKAMNELIALGQIGEKLHNHVGSMHRDTLLAAGGSDRSPAETAAKLQRLVCEIMDCATIGMRYLSITGSKADPPAKKNRAREITVAAIYVYEGLTGNRATRCHENESKRRSRDTSAYGPTKTFLGDVYDVLGINAKPEGQLRSILCQLPNDDLRPPKAPRTKRGKRAIQQ